MAGGASTSSGWISSFCDFIGTRAHGAVRVRLLTLVAALPSGPWGRAAPHLGAGGGGGCGEGAGGDGGGR